MLMITEKGKLRNLITLAGLIVCTNLGVETLRAPVPNDAVMWKAAPILMPFTGLWKTGTIVPPAGDQGMIMLITTEQDHASASMIVDLNSCTFVDQ